MGRKLFIYTTDKNRKYLTYLDEEIAKIEALGFRLASASEAKDLDFLPGRMKMRKFSCSKNKGGVYNAGEEQKAPRREFAVGTVSASIFDNRSPFRYKGSEYTPRRFHPEKRKK